MDARAKWPDRAARAIAAIDAALPANVTFEQRVTALRDGRPFAARRGGALRAWLRQERAYLARFAPPGHDSGRFPLSPLERLIARSMQ
ncbi:MAG: hypothetical protein ACI4Q3_03770 [Kiritimatiellia bacterium]